MERKCFVVGCVLIWSVFFAVSCIWAADVRGVSDTKIKLGCLVALSGPAQYAGRPVAEGVKDYTAWINDLGGIHGRQIELIVEDNGILPTPTLAAAKKVIYRDEVFAIPFNLGSAGTSAILPLCAENEVVLLPHGANIRFATGKNKWVFVASTIQYSTGQRAVEYILEQNPKAKIGVIYQDDEFGLELLAGSRDAAKYMNTKLVHEAPYATGTLEFGPHMAAMRKAGVDFLLAWTYLPQAAAILKEKAKMGWDVPVLGDNTTPVPLLFKLVDKLADGYLAVSDIAPIGTDVPGTKLVKDVNRKFGDPAKTINDPVYADYLHMLGWMHMAAMVEGLRNAGRELTPEALIKGMESIKDLDMKGIAPNLSFGPKKRAGSYSSMILRADASNRKFVVVDPFKEPKTPINFPD